MLLLNENVAWIPLEVGQKKTKQPSNGVQLGNQITQRDECRILEMRITMNCTHCFTSMTGGADSFALHDGNLKKNAVVCILILTID